MTRGSFFIAKQPDKPRLPGWYDIRLKVQNFPDSRLVTDGSIGISGWQLEQHAERFLTEFTDDELKQLEDLTYSMWRASPEGGERSPRWKISSRLEKLKRAVQKRCGPALRDS
jgi:hypothetical protein